MKKQLASGGKDSRILKVSFQQECIPVGYIPPVRYCMGGLCPGGVCQTVTPWTKTGLDREPPETPQYKDLLWTETPQYRDPLWTETPQYRDPLDRPHLVM